MTSESYDLKPLRNAIITQVIHVVITFIFIGLITFRIFYELLPLDPASGIVLIPFLMLYVIFGFLYLLILFLWVKWREAPGKHRKGLTYSSLLLAITSLFPPLLFGLIPAVLVYLASSRV